MAAIRGAGVGVEYDFEWDEFERAPPVLSRWIGPDYVADVVAITWHETAGTTDAWLMHLNGVTQLEALYLGASQVGDARLAHLRGLSRLRFLFLDGTQVGDAGLAHLARLTNLRVLKLQGTSVSDAGLVHLRGLTKLESLELNGTSGQ